ncbi:hypothetical protein [Moritella yayanosii]|uniref:Uncharacterized protein n=1 Tax=Moritella yayanosii TaxID=69539 RepID=A0A330LL33_9GAMM|nr:hypothetical protein [Moritella yayanosii]SQD76721.1 conserved protein of unknown function [Moritella yayanosii]
MSQTINRNDDLVRITVLSFMEQHPLLVDIENNDDIDLHTITAEHDVTRDSHLLQSDLVVVIYQHTHMRSAGFTSRRKIIDDNYIATIWLNFDELNTYHTLAALRFINHMASMLNQNKLLKFNISDISSLVSNSKSLRFLEADGEEIADVLAENDSTMSQNMVKNVIPDPTITDSAAMIIVTKEPISIRKINAGFDVINQVCEHKVPCYYGVHMSPKYSAKHTYLYLVGER